jgi:hypothetical protein
VRTSPRPRGEVYRLPGEEFRGKPALPSDFATMTGCKVLAPVMKTEIASDTGALARLCVCVGVCVCVCAFDKCLVRMSCAKMWACATQNRQPAAPAADCRTMQATHSRCVRSQASSTQPHMHMEQASYAHVHAKQINTFTHSV